MSKRIFDRSLCCFLILLLSACGSINQFISRLPHQNHYEHVTALDRTLVSKPPKIDLRKFKSIETSPGRSNQRGDFAIAIAASGGGYRAANLTAGVMLGLEELHPVGVKNNLLQEVDYYSTVSGSGFAAGVYFSHLARYLQENHTKPYSFKDEFYQPTHSIADLLRIDHSNDLVFGHHRSLRLESQLGHDLLEIKPNRPLLLGDIFIRENDPIKQPTLPMWVTNATILQNYEIFQFTPDVLTAYQITEYPHEYRTYTFNDLDAPIYGFDMPMVVGMTASATYPFAVDGTTMKSRACLNDDCYLHLFDGGLVDNIGLITAIDLLRQDPAKNKVLIIVDAYSNNLEPFSKSRLPPQRLDLFTSIMKSIGSSFQRNMKAYAKHVAKDILCAEGAERVLIVYLDLAHSPNASAIPTTMWMSAADQNTLLETGKKLVITNPDLKVVLPRMLQGATIANCSKPQINPRE